MRRYEAMRIVVYFGVGFILFYVLRYTSIWAYIPEAIPEAIDAHFGQFAFGLVVLLMVTGGFFLIAEALFSKSRVGAQKPLAAQLFLPAAFINFVVYIYVAELIGGHSYSGQSGGDQYFLGSGTELTSVSESVYRYSQVHAMSVVILIIVAFLISVKWSSGKKD